MSENLRENYKSNISIKNYANKLYVDPNYGYEEPKASITYSIFSSQWDLEEVGEDNIIRIIHRGSGDSISLAFNSLFDKIMFVKNIYSSQPIKQIGKGLNLENLANMHLKPMEETIFNKALKNYS